MRASDLRAVTQLCMEVGEIQSPAPALEHFVKGSARLLGADVTSLFGAHVDQQWYRAGAGMVHGLDASQMALVQQWYFDSAVAIQDPLNAALLAGGHPSAVKTRRHLLSDAEWYRNPHTCQKRELLGVDDALIAVRPLGDDSMIFTHHRSAGSRAFSSDDEERLTLLCELSRWFFESLRQSGIVVPVRGHPDLPPRLHKVLEKLLLGYSEKEVAARLGYRNATIHKYVEELYRLFNVSSRPELMARWIPRAEPTYQPVGGTLISSRNSYR
ncbi:MAG: helix-turn-helix transcriptional regulator [Candidatus Xenobia bacterium]